MTHRTIQRVYFPATGPFAAQAPNVNSSNTITTPKGHVNITGHYTCTAENVVYCLTYVYIGETGRRMADRFREHRKDVINGRNDLPVSAHFNQPDHSLQDMKVAVLKAGLVNQQHLKKQEMRYIFKNGTLAPSGLNHDFSFT